MNLYYLTFVDFKKIFVTYEVNQIDFYLCLIQNNLVTYLTHIWI
jgi:hypothetical protein